MNFLGRPYSAAEENNAGDVTAAEASKQRVAAGGQHNYRSRCNVNTAASLCPLLRPANVRIVYVTPGVAGASQIAL